MPNPDLSILVVDDAKFSNAIITKTLRKAGYRDVRIATNAATALQMLEERTVSVLLADWLMPEMDGLEMTERVRSIDIATDHFTYIILLTAKEGVEALAEAFDRGVDDFIHKSQMNKQLLPRIYAADRLAATQNKLLADNGLLVIRNLKLENSNLLDPVTLLGNRNMARMRLADMLRQTESRGGATNYMLIGIKNWPEISRNLNEDLQAEVAREIAKRLRQLTRPLDTICRIDSNHYVVISLFKDIEYCTNSRFNRICNGISLKAINTRSGFIALKATGSICTIDAHSEVSHPEHIEKVACHQLAHIGDTKTINLARWHELTAGEITEIIGS